MTPALTTVIVLAALAASLAALWRWVLFTTRIATPDAAPCRGRLVLVRRVGDPEHVHRRDLLLVRSVEAGRVLLRRAVGLPGDRVRLDDFGGLTVEDASRPAPWPRSASGSDLVCTVPPGQLLLLGDPAGGTVTGHGWAALDEHHRTWRQPEPLPGAVMGRVIFPRP